MSTDRRSYTPSAAEGGGCDCERYRPCIALPPPLKLVFVRCCGPLYPSPCVVYVSFMRTMPNPACVCWSHAGLKRSGHAHGGPPSFHTLFPITLIRPP